MTEATRDFYANLSQVDNSSLLDQAKNRQKSIDKMDSLNHWAFLGQVFISLGYIAFNKGEDAAVAWGVATLGLSTVNYYTCYLATERASWKNERLLAKLEKQQNPL